MSRLLSTKEVASLLDINEKQVYRLVAEKQMPATKVTGKWLFPERLVLQWIEANTINYPEAKTGLFDAYPSLFVIAGSNDVLLDRTMGLFMNLFPEYTAVFGNLGSLGGIRALKQGLCHIATSHLIDEDEKEYNFSFAAQEMSSMPAVVNFCFREQGLIIARDNPRNISHLADLAGRGITIVNRSTATGTRLWFDRRLRELGVKPEAITGYDREVQRHMDVGLAVLSGKADAGPGIRVVADILGLGFIPAHWERFDFLINKETFFHKSIQAFLSLPAEPRFKAMAAEIPGYDFSKSGKMVYPL
ncbi:MAG: helix-turn-helix transcriptional regulator [Thermodesulfobacteriota bacterium]